MGLNVEEGEEPKAYNGRMIMENKPERFIQGTQGLVYREDLIFEQTAPGRVGYSLPEAEVPEVPARSSHPGTPVARRSGGFPRGR